MATMPVTHILALAAADIGRGDDAVLNAQADGQAIDAEVDALDTITTCSALRALVHRALGPSGQQYTSGKFHRAILAWERDLTSRIRARALALFPEDADTDWIADLRGPPGP